MIGLGLVAEAGPCRADEIRVAVATDPAYSPFFLAKQQNLFQAPGQTVQLVQFSNAAEALDSVLAGLNQMAGPTETSALNRSTRADLRALAVFSQSGTFMKLVVRQGVETVADLKKLGVIPGSITEYATLKLLAKFNVDPGSVNFVAAGPAEFPALLSRSFVDGYILWEPWPTNGVKAGGHILMTTGDFGYVYNLLLVVPGPWLDTHGAEAAAIVGAVAKACDEIRADPEKAGAATQAEIKIPAAQVVDLLKDVTCRVRDFMPEDIASYRQVADFLIDKKITKTKPDVDKLIQKGFYKP